MAACRCGNRKVLPVTEPSLPGDVELNPLVPLHLPAKHLSPIQHLQVVLNHQKIQYSSTFNDVTLVFIKTAILKPKLGIPPQTKPKHIAGEGFYFSLKAEFLLDSAWNMRFQKQIVLNAESIFGWNYWSCQTNFKKRRIAAGINVQHKGKWTSALSATPW